MSDFLKKIDFISQLEASLASPAI